MISMTCFGRSPRRTAPNPTRDTSKNELVPSKPPRFNGWSWPPQAFQVIGWLVYCYLATVGFGIYVPLLPSPWSYVVYALNGVAFLVHLVTHVAAVTLDPADPSVKAKPTYCNPMPFFDRAKQKHIIHNLHCYICDVKVGPRAKHCGVCNKCVADFDHHCKWLNTCVGGQNYWCFFVALCSATLGVFLLLLVIMFIFIQHFLHPGSLRTAPQFHSLGSNGTWLVFLPVAPIQTSSVGLLVLAFMTVVLGVICLLLLGHLLGFHLYLMYKGISTFDYIKMQRQKEVTAGIPKSISTHETETQNQEISLECESTLQNNSSTCNYDDKGPLTLSESICTEMETFKKSAEKENGFHYGTEAPCEVTAGEMAVSDTECWRLGAEEMLQSAEQASVKSVDEVAVVQNPLGSSIMSPSGPEAQQ